MSDQSDFFQFLEGNFLTFAVQTGRLLADDERPPDYKGSVEHQRDLATRLGLNVDEYDPDNDEVALHFYNVFLEAQLNGKDASGKPLFIRDMWLLGAITGRSV